MTKHHGTGEIYVGASTTTGTIAKTSPSAASAEDDWWDDLPATGHASTPAPVLPELPPLPAPPPVTAPVPPAVTFDDDGDADWDDLDGHAEPLADLFADLAETYTPPTRRRLLPALAAGTLGVGLIMGMAVVPPTTVAAAITSDAVDYWNELPVDLPAEKPVPTYTVLLDANGEQFAQFYSENRIPVTLDQIAPAFTDALIATEDARFYDHQGVDLRGLARAAAVNFDGGGVQQGGSTLTQQLVENIRLIHAESATARAEAKAGSVAGKIQEIKYATALEEQYTKDEILEMYANTVYFGAGAYGIAAAAQRYFDVPPSELTLSQAATLAGLVKNPVGYNPLENPETAQARRDVVLGRMLTEGVIDQDQYDHTVAEQLTVTPGSSRNGCYDSAYPLYCSYVSQTLLNDAAFGDTREEREHNLYLGGMTITTALDPAAMDAAQNAVTGALGNSNRVAAAVAVVEPGTGHVTAIAQNREFGQGEGQTEMNYAATGFQTGSAFKGITLAAAFEDGIAPSLRLQSPSVYRPANLAAPEGGFSNFMYEAHGAIDLHHATRVSSNTVFVQLAERIGVREIAAMGNRLGLSLPTDLTGAEGSITLGAYESSPLEIATAHATFAADGIKCSPTPITQVVDTTTGQERPAPDTNCHRVLMPGVAATLNQVLTEPFKPGGTAEHIDLGRPAAGKTGTANNQSSAWFVGYTPQASAAVWVGDPRGGVRYPLHDVWAFGRHHWAVGGGDIAAPIWENAMRAIHANLPVENFTGASAPVLSLRATSPIPSVVGMSVEHAVGSLQAAGYQVRIGGETQDRPGAPVDTVAAQIELEDTVTLTLTTGSTTGLLNTQVTLDEGEVLVHASEKEGTDHEQ